MESELQRSEIRGLTHALDALLADLQRRPGTRNADSEVVSALRRELMAHTADLEESRREKDRLWAWCEGEILRARAEVELLRLKNLEIPAGSAAAQVLTQTTPAPE